ncbi:MAG: MaoC family dehydratase [Pseudomonadota bacterium]
MSSGGTPFRAFEDFEIGQVIELPAYRVAEAEILEFAKRFDPQTIHTDPVAAADGDMGGLIASGWHTAAMFMRMQCDGFLLRTSSIVSPGVDRVRWLKPVRPGDVLSGTSEVTEVAPSRSRPDRGTVYSDAVIGNQRGEVVMTLTTRNIYRRREA